MKITITKEVYEAIRKSKATAGYLAVKFGMSLEDVLIIWEGEQSDETTS